jgi:bifunctional DNA-binding transcriptional regulator/antitoxin component of YhaV-PrlF toxin-antitoxin module
MFKKVNQDFLRPEFNDWMSLKGSNLISKYDSFGTTLEYFDISNLDFFKSIHSRKFFNIKPGHSVIFNLDKKNQLVNIKPTQDFLSLAGSLSSRAIKGKTLQHIIDLEHKALEEAIVEDYLKSVE